jgi:hypothetical protein
MQGVQGIVQSATQAAGSAGAAGSGEPKADEAKADRPEHAGEREPKPDGSDERPVHRDEAQPGNSAEHGRAPEPLPEVQRAEPAQTRPQQSPL